MQKNIQQLIMKQSTLLLTVLTIFIGTNAFAQPQKLMADKIVGVVGNKIILKSDIDNALLDLQRQGYELPPDAKCLSLEQSMNIKALVLQAEKDSLPITDEEIDIEIDNRIRDNIMRFGSKDELEKVAGKTIYQLKEDMREPFRDQKLATLMRNNIVEGIKITPNEVNKFFSNIPTDSLPLYESEVEIGQIVIYPKASREAEQYAVEQLADFKKQIEAGKGISTIASLYSDDPSAKQNSGQFDVNRTEKNYDQAWLGKAFTLKEGQTSSPFKSKFGYHIIQMVSRAGDDAVVRHILKIPQVTTYELQAGLEKLDSVRAQLIAGTTDFGTAVNKHSEDEGSKFTGGMLQGPNGSFLTIDQLDKDIIPALRALKIGQYSQPISFTDDRGKKGVKLIYLKTQTEAHRENLKDDYSRISQKALEYKKEEALEKWFNNKISSYYIVIDGEYTKCEVMSKWVKAASVHGAVK